MVIFGLLILGFAGWGFVSVVYDIAKLIRNWNRRRIMRRDMNDIIDVLTTKTKEAIDHFESGRSGNPYFPDGNISIEYRNRYGDLRSIGFINPTKEQQLQSAIDAEDFERAAQLRDEIAKLNQK